MPSGFLNPDESAEEGAIRELTEETGHDGGYTN
ncbi:MAG: NUDIX domain-containing protein [Sodaliphilus sp.]|nr:NUDIX domain-containing protein [Bacteroidales bacterium]MDY5706433.1 NUDIX domain-containing protein [Sodaliphilus sp.]MDY5878130.1 NUDIX domain-containing protein [Sodaliphilus sp.]